MTYSKRRDASLLKHVPAEGSFIDQLLKFDKPNEGALQPLIHPFHVFQLHLILK